ncbi:MAG: Iron-sulfur cluster carrier protein [Phycisphaerae bacterium]|nr:Iron-sulfur cluster carrier protein [Phycisphaerae bacterium]
MPELPRRIALINQKGGVGKTTTAVNLGAALARAGRRVLLVDMDPQSHLTMHVGVEPDESTPTVYDVLVDGRPAVQAVRDTASERLRVLPATIDLAAAEVELVGVVGREVILRDALTALADAGESTAYDYLLLDCPPSLGLLTLNALAAADEVFICLQPHFLALQGVGKLLETVSLVYQRINPRLRVTGVILCMYETGTRLAGEVTDDLVSYLDENRAARSPWSEARIFRTIIRRNIKLAECPSFGQHIFQYEPLSHGANDYAALAAEVVTMEPGTSARSPQNDAGLRPAPAPIQVEATTPDVEAVEAAGVGEAAVTEPEAAAAAPPQEAPSDETPAAVAADPAPTAQTAPPAAPEPPVESADPAAPSQDMSDHAAFG